MWLYLGTGSAVTAGGHFGVLLLLLSIARSPEVECAAFYPRQPQMNNKPYLSSEVIMDQDLFYLIVSNIRTNKLFNKNQETGKRFPGNSVYIKDAASG